MNSTNLHVLSNIIAGVESGGQQYSDNRDWTAYAGAHTNSDKEVTCTLGPYQAYGDEAQQVCEYVNSVYPSVMAAVDSTGQIRAHIKSGFISTSWNPGASDKANLIKMLGTPAGREACEHVFDERLLKYVANAEARGVKTVSGQMMWAEIEHLGGLNPTVRVFNRCGGNYSLDGILSALKVDQAQTGSNSVSSAKYWSRHTACISMIKAHMSPEEMNLTADSFVRQIAAVCAMAKAQHFKYGNSRTAIPCADQVISCDRMIARALYDFGCHDQGDGGIVISTMEKYLTSHGWDKITSQSLKAGDIVLVAKGAPVHTFVVERFGSVNDIDKYDEGSQERIDSGGHFQHVKLVEWADRTFYCAFRIHEDKKEESVHYISNCGHDEHGTYSGGQAGDQTGTEWQLRSWYSRPWNMVFRYPNSEIGKLIADLSVEAANNNLIGYDQGQRETFWSHLEASHYHPSQITIACETDCSAGVAAIVKAVGYLASVKAMQAVDIDMDTGSERSELTAAGFTVLTDSKYLTSAEYLMPGDILLCSGHHTAINVTKGSQAAAAPAPAPTPSAKKTVTLTFTVPIQKGDKGIDVLAVQEVLRSRGYKGTDGKTVIKIDRDYGDNSECAVKTFQQDNKLPVTGIVDETTMLRLFGKG